MDISNIKIVKPTNEERIAANISQIADRWAREAIEFILAKNKELEGKIIQLACKDHKWTMTTDNNVLICSKCYAQTINAHE